MTPKQVSVMVAGSWGTAIAEVLADNDLDVMLWTRNSRQAEEINLHHTNSRYLKDVVLSKRIRATVRIDEALAGSQAVILVPPSSAMREIARSIRPHIKPGMLLLHATKGFEAESLSRMTTVIASEIPDYDKRDIVVLSGPSHAEEVIAKCPTALVVASENPQAAERAQDLLINSYFRVYTNPDVAGVEVGGALKNIIALGAGLSDGLGFGDNAKAALMTRGLAEIARLGMEMGANPLTFSGLTGVGDLIVTGTSRHSRNWRAGYMLAQGTSLEEVLQTMGMVVEGVKTTKAAYRLAEKFAVTMPITSALYAVLFEGKSPKIAVEDLMGRGKTHEIEEIATKTKDKWMR